MNRSDVLNIIENNTLSPNVKLGQNFLVSEEMTDKIISVLDLSDDDSVLEIGPGLGALSQHIARKVEHLHLVEIDSGLVEYLRKEMIDENISIQHADFLKMDHEKSFSKIVSNLPYYCASEILFTIALKYSASFLYVMMQKEMAERIISEPGSKQYGALTVNLNFYFKPQLLFNVPRSAFFPRPDVSSSFMKFSRRNELLLSDDSVELFHNIVKSAFWGRRKKIVTALTNSPFLDLSRQRIEKIVVQSGIDPDVRGENLGLERYIDLVKIANILNKGDF